LGINNYIARQFGKPTGFGGRIITAIMNRQNYPLYEETVQRLSPCSSESVLDIGCGNGYVLGMLAARSDCFYVGIDISESILKSATKRNHRFVKNGNMTFKYGEAARIPFGSAVFDKAYTINTVYFWEELNDIMTEVRRVLKPGGMFVNTLYTNDTLARFSHTQFGYKRFAQGQLISAAQYAGFGAKAIPIMGGAAYCVICNAPNP